MQDNFDLPSPEQDGKGSVSLEDYRPIDPVPSSKTSIRPGPIQHEAPLLPYLPQPAPPPIEEDYSLYPWSASQGWHKSGYFIQDVMYKLFKWRGYAVYVLTFCLADAP